MLSVYDMNRSFLLSTPSDVSHLEVYHILNQNIPDIIFKEVPIVYFILGSALNAILVLYIIRSGKWRSPTFAVVCSVAIADVLTCSSAVIWGAYIYPIMEPNLGWLCHLSMFMGFGGCTASGYNLIFFAALRFYQLTSPLAARARVTTSFAMKGCAIVWFFTQIMYGLLWGILYGPKQVLIDGLEVTVCEQFGNYHASNIGFLILNTCVPSLSISILHLAKYFKVSKAQKSVETSQERLNPDARAVSIVIAMYIICWFPVHLYIVTMGIMVESYHMFQDKLGALFIWVLCSNSTVNPIIYCIAAKSIRQDLIRFLFCQKSDS